MVNAKPEGTKYIAGDVFKLAEDFFSGIIEKQVSGWRKRQGHTYKGTHNL